MPKLIDILHTTFDVYWAPDRDAAEIRAAHLRTLLRLTPLMMGANLVNAALVLFAFRHHGLWAWTWFALVVLVAVAGLVGGWRFNRAPRAQSSPRAMRRAARHAGVLAVLWVAPLVWFAEASPAQQFLLGVLVTGMLAGGAFVLATLPAASLIWVGVLAGGALLALLGAGEPLFYVIAGLLACYATVVALGAMAWSRQATALLVAEREAARQGQMLALLLHDFEEHANDALWETAWDGRLSHGAGRLARLLDLEERATKKLPLVELLAARGYEGVENLRAALFGQRAFRELRLTLQEGGQRRAFLLSAKPLFDDAGRIDRWRGVIADVTAQAAAQDRLNQLAHFDSLTGLANRVTLHETLQDAVRTERMSALLSIDLDHFKDVNDTLGHSAGDALLCAVAQRLKSCVRPGDLVARLGGDEFAVFMRRLQHEDDSHALARRIVAELQQPFELGDRNVRIGASVGVALCPQHGRHVDELLGNADLALYDAKTTGRGRATGYSPVLGERNRRRAVLESDLRRALSERRLALHWQPKIDLERWRICGVEALVRWEHATFGAIQPSEFVALAEQVGLIDELGHWVLREACQTAVRDLHGLSVAVNVSPAQLARPDFVDQVRRVLADTGLPPGQLELEITESIFIDDVDGALDRLHALRHLGLQIVLDDFGTGYSSLAYLRRFTFDTLKIDRSFVHESLAREDAKAIVRTITQLATTLGIRTTAEGVETRDQLLAMQAAGCHEAQGFFVAPPQPLPDFLAVWRGWPARPELATDAPGRQAMH
ncbi:MAG: putative bifunctional diguanylate cyclase/phosphodiesterase [Gammaproteobacteria bacterium]